MSDAPRLLDYNQDLPYNELLPTSPLLVSHGQWNGVVLEHHDAPSWEMPECYLSHHHIGVLLDDWHGEQRVEGRIRSNGVPKGALSLIPAYMPFAAQWKGRSRAIILAIDPALLGRVAHDVVDGDRIEMAYGMVHEGDPFVTQILQLLRDDAAVGYPIGPLYGESLVTALAAHLIKNHSVTPSLLPTHAGKIPRYRLNPVLEYIENSLHKPITLQELAAIAEMSQYYFCRMFRQTTGVTPLHYVRQKRIERAKLLLKQRHLTVFEVGLQCGFVNPSHFTRQFYQVVGVTPKSYRDKLFL